MGELTRVFQVIFCVCVLAMVATSIVSIAQINRICYKVKATTDNINARSELLITIVNAYILLQSFFLFVVVIVKKFARFTSMTFPSYVFIIFFFACSVLIFCLAGLMGFIVGIVCFVADIALLIFTILGRTPRTVET